MMAGRTGSWKTFQLLFIFSLLNITKGFEVKEDDWEELSPDIAALHRLKGLSEHMFHEQLNNSSDTSSSARVRRSIPRLDFVNVLSLWDGFQEGENVTDYLMTKEEELGAILEHLKKQKIEDWLISASEISHSYGQKVLVVTDKEPSTSERVKQEYSMDPQYSVVVHVECLNNESCVPEADRNTVVKIFGSVSEDGETVSGRSGSSLADLILKPRLEAAAVFSLGGNTTTEFQRNFIGVLKVRGLKAVLETVQDNHQIYKVMDQSDSVATYKIPERPVDHSTQYDHQQIIMLEDNKVVRTAAESLYEKHPTVSSVYVLDNNLKPRLIHGEPAPLSENSRLVLVGHGARDPSGQMRLAGFTSPEVTKIIQNTHRVSDQIKTTSVVACDVGSDEPFVETLVKELHQAGIETELHLRNSLVQVKHTGEKITQEFTSNGEYWRHKDDSKKVVATLDKNGDVIIRREAGSKGDPVFINERNFLGNIFKPTGQSNKQTQNYRNKWPEEPKRFIDPEVYREVDQNKAGQIQDACEELQALSWGLFHSGPSTPEKGINVNLEEEQYVIGEKNKNNIVEWINENKGLRQVFDNCYEIKSGKDILNVIHHYAKTGETELTYLKVNDWIFVVDPTNLYMYPVGKKLVNTENINDVKELIIDQNQKGRQRYSEMQGDIPPNERKQFADYVRDLFQGKRSQTLNSKLELSFAWYFAASVIAESARNFRTFPVILMALDMIYSGSNAQEELKSLFENHPMARGGSWTDTSSRGFSGTAATKESIKPIEESIKSMKESIKPIEESLKSMEESIIKESIKSMKESIKSMEESIIKESIKSMKESIDSVKVSIKPIEESLKPIEESIREESIRKESIKSVKKSLKSMEESLKSMEESIIKESIKPMKESIIKESIKSMKESIKSMEESIIKESIKSMKESIDSVKVSIKPIEESLKPIEESIRKESIKSVKKSLKSMDQSIRYIDKKFKGLKTVLKLEYEIFTKWKKTVNGINFLDQFFKIAGDYKVAEMDSLIKRNYNQYKEALEHEVSLIPPRDGGEPPSSGALGGHDDGYVTMRDLNSASELENSFRHEAYFSKASASLAEEIHTQLKKTFGEDLAGLQVKKGTDRIENGQFICQLESHSVDAESVEFRAQLSAKTQKFHEELLRKMDKSVQDMEEHSLTSSHRVSKIVEHAGTAVGVLGLMLGAKGSVRSFEQGDIKGGVMGTLQTVHGTTALASSAIARTALSSEARCAKAAVSIMKSPAMKGTMTAIPILGIGFGIYNVVEDFKRNDALGYIDAALDLEMVYLDVVELVVPELIPLIAPINLALSVVRMVVDDIYMGIKTELENLPKDAGLLSKIDAVLVGFEMGVLHFDIRVASFFYDWRYDEIEEGRRLVTQISDYHKYYIFTKEEDGMTAIDFSGGPSSWNGGGINFCLADQGPSQLCMDSFVSSDESFGKRCWDIDAKGSTDIILGTGESHELEHTTLKRKVLLFIPAGSVPVVSGYKAASYSRYGTYTGNSASNRFFAVQKADDQQVIEVLLSYYYRLYGEPGDDTFFLGPQRSYVQGSGGKDTYLIPENGGKTIINNYDPSKALDTLHFSVDYRDISVYKSGDHIVLMYESSHSVTIENWFLGELYRHMIMMSGDGVLFEISSTVVTSVQLVATGINKMFEKQGENIDASDPPLCTVTNIIGTQFDDVILGNDQNNLIDGGGGRDRLTGGEGEDIYNIKGRNSSVLIENVSKDRKTDLAIIEANLDSFNLWVEGDDVKLEARHDNTPVYVTLVNWFRSPADRHLIIVTKDLVTFTISDNKADCLQSNKFLNCIKLQIIDYSSSSSPLVVDLQEDTALNSLTEVRGSKFNDVIKGNKEHNVFLPGGGEDCVEGGGGEDWYVITPGEGETTINNQSPDLVLDKLFLKEQYESLASVCEQQNIIILVNGRRTVVLENWFHSRDYQHLQIRTSDGVTAGLKTNISSCGEALILPLIIDYRNLFHQTGPVCHLIFTRSIRLFCGLDGKEIMMKETDSVKEMYGSSGFDIMVGNKNDNLLDPYTGGAIMSGREGEDTYIIKRGYGDNVLIDNFAEDQRTDTVVVDMDFIDGGQVVLDSSTEDLSVTIKTEGEELKFSLISYSAGDQHQHLDFLSSDGVRFKLKPLNSSADAPQFQVEAFKVTMKQAEVDCRLDLSTQRNLSKVQTAQGCPSQSNYMVGNNQDNVLIGGWKDDALDGGEGDDTLIGGHGADILIGGMGDDTLYGEDGNDTMMGDSGRDVFIPGPGSDLVDGGSGRDTVLYRGDHETGSGVYVNLLSGQGHYADAEGDVLKDVETVIGTIYSDILVSGYESSLLKGSDGNDILVSTGEDYLVGGDGNDIYLLAFDHGSVTIDNCAKDNATDVLYFNSQSLTRFSRRFLSRFNQEFLSDRIILSFFGPKQSVVKIGLKGWKSDESECGHLMLVLNGWQISLGDILIFPRRFFLPILNK